MQDRIIQIRNLAEAKHYLDGVGAYETSFKIMAPKSILRILYLADVPFTCANILKQEMLSLGGEVALSKGIISGEDKKSNCLVFGNLSQLEKLLKKLKRQPRFMQRIKQRIEILLNNYQKTNFEFKAKNFKLNLSSKTYIMGVLNITPDSFSDGGQFFDHDKAYLRGLELEKEGAKIIDIGGQSTRPGAKEISVNEEINRIIPVIKRLRGKIKIPISVDTYKFKVAKVALQEGASVLNDIFGFRKDRRLAKLAKKYRCGVVLMHIKGTPRTMQKNPEYRDLMGEIISSLKKSIDIALEAKIDKESIILDPGIGFGKTLKDNLKIFKNLSELKCLGFPILVGSSRKSFIGKILKKAEDERLYGTLASISAAIMAGAHMVRVHDVAVAQDAVKITDSIMRS